MRDLNRGGTIEEALRVDQDTDKVAGWPDIAATILAKIECCELFIADLTPINGPNPESRLTPNPNVLLELGYALATRMGTDSHRLHRERRILARGRSLATPI